MSYMNAFRENESLIKLLGEGNAHLVWVMGLYFEEPDLEALASEALTDGPDDRKIDFIKLDEDSKRIVFAQGYYGKAKKDSAPANKASDLNTAAAWLFSGDLESVPLQTRTVIEECRTALNEGEIDSIELLYVHNLPESVNVNKELHTASTHLKKSLGKNSPITVTAREFGSASIQNIFASQESHIEVKEEIICPAKVAFTEKGPNWEASVMTVPGLWLHSLFAKYGDTLFSANYRGFLGITKRRRINSAIRTTAESKPKDFWVFNNGITLLTFGLISKQDKTILTGVSIINGAQTTGSIGSVDPTRHDLRDMQVLCRIIRCSDPDTIGEIVKFNNTQNQITTWDQYSRDPEQLRIEDEFKELGHTYSRKRGFRPSGEQIGIEEVAQPLVAFHGRFLDSNRGKNRIFERRQLYSLAFEGKKARHILFVYALAKAIDERRIELKRKSNSGTIITIEEEQLSLLRNLRFKYFFITAVAQSLETILGRKVNVETVAFTPEVASTKNNSLLGLIAGWYPIVETVLAYIATSTNAEEFGKQVGDDDVLENVTKPLIAMLYASRDKLPFDDFRVIVSDS